MGWFENRPQLCRPDRRDRHRPGGRGCRYWGRGLAARSRAIIGSLALDGSETCSGLSVPRYDAARLSERLGKGTLWVRSLRHDPITPWGSLQRFHFGMLRKA